MRAALKKLSGRLSDGFWLSARPEIEPLDLARDFPDIERLFALEEWPFTRGDVELSHRQPLAIAHVARKNGRFAGFFLTHAFGDVGYLDMMIIDPAFRSASVARPLYFKTVNALKQRGVRSFVVHTTNDSARLIRLLGFRPGQNFTLVAREPRARTALKRTPSRLIGEDRDAILALDEAVFGLSRPHWIDALLEADSVELFGLRRAGELVASLCLRGRRRGAVCLDAVNAVDDENMETLVRSIIGERATERVECFVRTGSRLHEVLVADGFRVPEFFHAIGPLVEWRKGDATEAGRSERVQTLSWF